MRHGGGNCHKGSQRGTGDDEGATTIAFVPEKGWFWHIPQHNDMVSVGIVAEGKYPAKVVPTMDRREALDGADAVVFTGGIGENSAEIRERVGRGAAWRGVQLDAAANRAGGPRISAGDSRTTAWVLPTNEELMIARHTRRVLG